MPYLNDQHLSVISVNVKVHRQWRMQMKNALKHSRGARIKGLRLVKVHSSLLVKTSIRMTHHFYSLRYDDVF